MNKKSLLVIASICSVLIVVLLLLMQRSQCGVEKNSPDVVKKEAAVLIPVVVETPTPIQVKEVLPPRTDVKKTNIDEIHAELSNLNMSSAVRTLVGMDGSKDDYRARSKAFLSLTKSLSPTDVEAMRLFLYFNLDEDSSIRPLSFSALKNNALDVLVRQERLPKGLGFQIVDMFSNEANDSVWRDYCIQYLNPYYEARWSVDDRPANDPEHKKISETYSKAMEDTSQTYAGSALLGMHLLSKRYSVFDKKKIKDAAVRLVNDVDALEANKITGLLVCAQLGRTEVLPETRMLAQSGETITLRMAAIATLGELGDATDEELLKSLIGSSEKRIQTIATTALTKLEKRMSRI